MVIWKPPICFFSIERLEKRQRVNLETDNTMGGISEMREYNVRPATTFFPVAKVQYKDGSFGLVLCLGLINNVATDEMVVIHLGDDISATKWVGQLEDAIKCIKSVARQKE